MTKKIERHFFPGGNTAEGFYSFYDYIIEKKDANRIFCMKGGPGTGKSSLMKKIANHYSNEGYSIEYHHCSSDNNSLDGVVIKELKVCILDGTSPHIVDPKYPIAIDEVLNMGDCLDTSKVSLNRNEIISVSSSISNLFNRAYRFFSSAAHIYKDIEFFNQSFIDKDKLVCTKNDLIDKIFTESPKVGYGKERHLFGTAFTPNGIVSYIPNITEDITNQYILDGNIGTGKTYILTEIAKLAQESGFFVEYYHTPLIHEKLEAIVIPELDTCVVSKNVISKLNFSGIIFDMSENRNAAIPDDINNQIQYDYNMMMALLNKGLTLINDAHSEHDVLESYYIGAMDFSKADSIYEDVIKMIDSYK